MSTINPAFWLEKLLTNLEVLLSDTTVVSKTTCLNFVKDGSHASALLGWRELRRTGANLAAILGESATFTAADREEAVDYLTGVVEAIYARFPDIRVGSPTAEVTVADIEKSSVPPAAQRSRRALRDAQMQLGIDVSLEVAYKFARARSARYGGVTPRLEHFERHQRKYSGD